MGFLKKEMSIEELELAKQRAEYKREIAEARLTESQKIALRQEAEKRYGKGWQKMFANMGGGVDWNALKFRCK